MYYIYFLMQSKIFCGMIVHVNRVYNDPFVQVTHTESLR